MRSTLRDTLFSEPSGRRLALVQFFAAASFLGIYVYGAVRGSSGGVWVLLLATASVLSGTAEALPGERRRAAGVLRVTAVLVCVGLIALLAVAPDALL